uniref:Uncharacterized protein n=1 Tax=Dunaliella tertiolecta TaxID=3047 RepID=A0A6S8PPB3_DUNTE
MGIWRVIGSTRLHNLAARSILVFNSTPSGNKLVGIHDRMGMKFASKFIGALMVKSQLFKLVKGVLSVAGPTNTQKDGVESHNFCINEFAEVCMLPLCRLQLLSRPRVFTVLDFNQVHMPLVYIQLVGLPHAVGCCGPQCGVVSAA